MANVKSEKYPNLLDRFINYTKKNTRSDETSSTTPSTISQVNFDQELEQEMNQIGLTNVHYLETNGYLYGTLPANSEKDVTTIGFISHVDTADFNAENVNPQIVAKYDGGKIKLGRSNYFLDPAEFPNLKKYQGQTLITTDGTTLLGADDKAGVAEIMSAMEYLILHPEIKHGEVLVAFSPDEEIGIGADKFDLNHFPARFAYTVDGGELGELQYETFNAAKAEVEIKGKNVHPGSAKGIMINALQLAIDFHKLLPPDEVPEQTDGRDGFFFLSKIDGTVDEAKLEYNLRDFSEDGLDDRKRTLIETSEILNYQYGKGRVNVYTHDQYYNMREVIEEDFQVVEIAKKALEELNITPIIEPIRGGTDGSKISDLGIPTPNLFAGGENMHGRFEFVSLQTMERATDTIIKIIELYEQEG